MSSILGDQQQRVLLAKLSWWAWYLLLGGFQARFLGHGLGIGRPWRVLF